MNKKYAVNVLEVPEQPEAEAKLAKKTTAMDYPATLWFLSITIVILLVLLGLVITNDYHAMFGVC